MTVKQILKSKFQVTVSVPKNRSINLVYKKSISPEKLMFGGLVKPNNKQKEVIKHALENAYVEIGIKSKVLIAGCSIEGTYKMGPRANPRIEIAVIRDGEYVRISELGMDVLTEFAVACVARAADVDSDKVCKLYGYSRNLEAYLKDAIATKAQIAENSGIRFADEARLMYDDVTIIIEAAPESDSVVITYQKGAPTGAPMESKTLTPEEASDMTKGWDANKIKASFGSVMRADGAGFDSGVFVSLSLDGSKPEFVSNVREKYNHDISIRPGFEKAIYNGVALIKYAFSWGDRFADCLKYQAYLDGPDFTVLN